MRDDQFRHILEYFGFSWRGYRNVRKGVMKRLSRHMQEMGCRTLDEYINALRRDSELRIVFYRLMTVSISRFFRDRKLWHDLEKEVLPSLAKKQKGTVKVWCAGCASGEEPYSVKITWELVKKWDSPASEIEILATDLNPEYIERAKSAVYASSSLKEVPEEIRLEFFEPQDGNTYSLKSWVKEGIVWQVQDLLDGPPQQEFDLIFLRNNLLTYYEDHVKISALRKIMRNLKVGGFLVIGSHERLPAQFSGLRPWKDTVSIYQQRDSEYNDSKVHGQR